jgi:hypothetical protein
LKTASQIKRNDDYDYDDDNNNNNNNLEVSFSASILTVTQKFYLAVFSFSRLSAQ